MPSSKPTDRLTHEQLRNILTPAPGGRRDEFVCPLCEHGHFQLFGDDGYDCKNGCENRALTKRLHELVGNGHKHAPKVMPKPSASSFEEPSGSLATAEFGIAKCIDSAILKRFNVTEGPHPFYKKVTNAVCFNYCDENGQLVTQQWRWGMDSKCRRFLPNKPSYLYGRLQFINALVAQEGLSALFICEGESNTLTLDQAGFPAFGLPGVGNWQAEWANLPACQAAERIYFLYDMRDGEPEPQALAGAAKVAKSFGEKADKVYGVRLPTKDISDLWVFHQSGWPGDGERGFRKEFQSAILEAKPVLPKFVVPKGLPPNLGDEVFKACPILRDFVERVSRCLESDVNNIVSDFLACAGAAIGVNAHAKIAEDIHRPATFHMLIAPTSSGKGTCFGVVDKLYREASNFDWPKSTRRGLRSAQALVRAINESCEEFRKQEDGEDSEKSNPKYTEGRMLFRSSEIAELFKSFKQEWSTMSHKLRDVYDGGPVANEVADASKSYSVTKPYAVSIAGDVTPWELSTVINDVDFANGVANRFVWCVSHQARKLPRPPRMPDLSDIARRLRTVLPTEPLEEFSYSEEGGAVWDAWVATIPDDDSKLGSACGRMRANALRLAVLFAVLDEQRLSSAAPPQIKASHVRAAAAIMDRHRATVGWFLANPTSIPKNLPEKKVDTLWSKVEKLKSNLVDGQITAESLRALFSHETVEERRAIAEAAGLKERTEKTSGRGRTVWCAT